MSLDENTCTQAMKLLKETKHLLQTNVSAFGNGTVCVIGLYCPINVKIRWGKVFMWTNRIVFCLYQVDEAERFWFAFILFSIKRLSEKKQGSDDNGYTLCQILRAAKLKYVYSNFLYFVIDCFFVFRGHPHIFVFHSIVDFFKELPQFVVKAGPTLSNIYGADWENRLEVLVWQ